CRLRRGAASSVSVPRAQGVDPGGAAGRGPGAQAAGGPEAVLAAGAAQHPCRQACGATEATLAAEGRRAVPASAPLRAASPDGRRAESPWADEPGAAATADVAGHHGRGVSAVRSPLPHRHGVGEIGPAPSTDPSVPEGPTDLGQAVLSEPGEGLDVPGRPAD